MKELRGYGLAAVAFALSLYSVFTHQYDEARFYSLMAVLAVIVADLADVRRELRARRGRCTAVFVTDYGDRRCDLPAQHDGPHIRNDGCGRPEYVWTHDGQRWTP